MKIQFQWTDKVEPLFLPTPASALLPDWYKNQESYIGNQRRYVNGETMGTIKKCIPVLDALTAGYLLYSQSDIQIIKGANGTMYEWPRANTLDFHPPLQAIHHHKVKDSKNPIAKWLNQWVIITPRGYSCLIINPIQRDLPFTLIEGIVDTDDYKTVIHFPFFLNDPNWEGVIPAGTPIAQVIPFKRDSFKMEILPANSVISEQVSQKVRSVFYGGYKRFFWKKKEYK
jgi:hypothetical protein